MKKIDIDFFGDGMRIFLAYIDRQVKKNPDYKPHPIIRAFECAIQGIENAKEGEHVMGVSQDGTKDSVYEPYIVVLQKQKNGKIEVKEIRNIKVNKKLPLDVMIIIFRLQIQLDKIKGEVVTPQQAVDALNAVIPGNKFYALGDKWKEARDEFKKQLQEGKIYLPNDPELIEGLKKIRYDTPWEEYPQKVRALIGGALVPSLNSEGGVVTVTTPKNWKIEKYKVFDMATEFILGQTSEYLKLFGNKDKKT
jgi:hypothetical protein